MISTKEMTLNGSTLTIETGRVARQAGGSVLLTFGETVLLATVVGAEERSELSFFPLTVDYREKAYAAGKIPGGYIKREGRPSDKEILTSRLIDRSLRPLFADGFKNEVQVLVTVLSADMENPPDILGITAASAALSISDVPWDGPVAGVRIGKVDGEFIANPTSEQIAESDIDLIISATDDSVIMVEGESWEVTEEEMLAALEFGGKAASELVKLQSGLVEEAGKEKNPVIIPEAPEGLEDAVRKEASDEIAQRIKTADKKERRASLKEYYAAVTEKLLPDFEEDESFIKSTLFKIEKEKTRAMVLDQNLRLDGRGPDDIRDISCEVGTLPRTHGSALFTRGQTQSLGVVTLGTKTDEQRVDDLEGEFFKTYMLHYNFPPYSVGEIRPMRGTGRREIGHGDLAERSLKPVIPTEDVFPYTIRVVSEIFESNGSSSMATVCSGALALMDAGVPIKEPVAGIAMGLIKEGDKAVVLTDILGDEDHLGDMDFKVAGTKSGITAFQMDIKVKGISMALMKEALEKAQSARLRILQEMTSALDQPRTDLSEHAPRIISFKIKVESIGAVIGPGGKVIKDIVERTGATVDIADDGTVKIAAVEAAAGQMARNIVLQLVEEPETGKIYKGPVKRITNFGAFVEILPGKEGLLHISEVDHNRIDRVEDVLQLGDVVTVKLLRVEGGKFSLSRRAVLSSEE